VARDSREIALYELLVVLAVLLGGIRRFTKYDATGLLQAKRRVADAAIEAEKHIF